MDLTSLRERDRTEAFSVSELNNYIKNLFENNRSLTSVTVKGEISNFTNHRSGHFYFSLKDSEGQIRAVMFRSHTMKLKFVPESGMKVIVHGAVTVYPRDGSYQIYVSSIQPDGIGALYLAYEQLKARLAEEGLFDEDHKLPVPYIPSKIGVITSPTGAAVRDIINVTQRRFPLANIYIYPALVQGEGAEDDLIRAVDYFDKSKLVDTVIIGRGGGSIEDLWAFNSERLARRIYDSNTPVISAVGHETDFTICDFVADLRAPTPSAAAELAVPDIKDLLLRIDLMSERGTKALMRCAERARERLTKLSDICTVEGFDGYVKSQKECVLTRYIRVKDLMDKILSVTKHEFAINVEKINVMNPLAVLARGYAIAECNGRIIKSSKCVDVGDKISLKLSEGKLLTVVSEIDT